MAIQNILDAIVKEADEQIASAQTLHRQRLKEIREQAERSVAQKKRSIAERKESKMNQIREKATSRANILRRQAILAKKQENMDRLYKDVMSGLASLPTKNIETFLRGCLERIDSKGTVFPSKAHKPLLEKLLPDGMKMGETIDAEGGFRFSSDREEHDFTYEFIVQHLLRPMTDVDAAHGLFSDL